MMLRIVRTKNRLPIALLVVAIPFLILTNCGGETPKFKYEENVDIPNKPRNIDLGVDMRIDSDTDTDIGIDLDIDTDIDIDTDTDTDSDTDVNTDTDSDTDIDTDTDSDADTDTDTDTDTIRRLVWAVRAGGPNHPYFGGDGGSGIATTGDGSVLTTGIFTGAAIFGSAEKNQTTIDSDAYWRSAIFLARYGENGLLSWVVQTKGKDRMDNSAVATGPNGIAMLTGDCRGNVTFESTKDDGIALNCKDESNLFVARYSSDGRPEWVAQVGGSGDLDVSEATVIQNGSTFVSGTFSNRITFGPGEKNATTLFAQGKRPCLFVAKYDENGALEWAIQSHGTGSVQSSGITSRPDGVAIVTGSFTGKATFGPRETGEIQLTSAGKEDIFVAAFSSDGNPVWAVSAGGIRKDEARDIAIFPGGSTIVMGTSEDEATFGKGEPNMAVLAKGSTFIARYNRNGTFKTVHGTAADGYSVASLKDGSFAITGRFVGEETFGKGEKNEATLTGAGDIWPEDAFVARYNPDGTLAWVVQAGGSEYFMDANRTMGIGDRGRAITSDKNGSAVYTTGFFLGTAIFDSKSSNAKALVSSGGFDAFVMRLTP